MKEVEGIVESKRNFFVYARDAVKACRQVSMRYFSHVRQVALVRRLGKPGHAYLRLLFSCVCGRSHAEKLRPKTCVHMATSFGRFGTAYPAPA